MLAVLGIYTLTKVKSHSVFFSKLFFFIVLRMKEVEPEMHFCNILLWIKSQALISYLKLIMKSNRLLLQVKNGDNKDIIKLQKRFIWLLFFNNLRKRTRHIVFTTFV